MQQKKKIENNKSISEGLLIMGGGIVWFIIHAISNYAGFFNRGLPAIWLAPIIFLCGFATYIYGIVKQEQWVLLFISIIVFLMLFNFFSNPAHYGPISDALTLKSFNKANACPEEQMCNGECWAKCGGGRNSHM